MSAPDLEPIGDILARIIPELVGAIEEDAEPLTGEVRPEQREHDHLLDKLAALADLAEIEDQDAGAARLERDRRRHQQVFQHDEDQRIGWARELWLESEPITGTIAADYLNSRGCTIPASRYLRFHPSCRHLDGSTWPALVCAFSFGSGVPADHEITGVHRTYLLADGLAKAPVNPVKAMIGPCAGGAVRLAAPRQKMVVAEGLENGIAVMMATNLPTWCAMSAGNLANVLLPPIAADIIIAADADTAGIDAAKAAEERWVAEGRRVRVALPPIGMDFADLLNGDEL